jgi:hypothetical protein
MEIIQTLHPLAQVTVIICMTVAVTTLIYQFFKTFREL